jgi:flagellar biosynthetic protein FliQ
VSVDEVAAAVRGMLLLTLLLTSPFLATAMLASLIVSVVQGSTRINDLTLSFVPRFVATMVVLYLAAGWTLSHLAGFIERSFIAAATFGR